MVTMRSGIVGGGNAGCWTALYFAYYGKAGTEIDLYYDPAIPPEPVGQATLPGSAELLWKTLGINWYDNKIKATPKTGVLYRGWGTKSETYFHPFPLNIVALHYTPIDLRNAILGSGLFRVHETNILEPSAVDADYVFDCRGFPKSYEDYELLDNPRNSVITGTGPTKEADTTWTTCTATQDGWTFSIPNLMSRSSHGYLYNNTITPRNEALDRFQQMFAVDEIGKEIQFRNYVAKEPIVDSRIIKSGNRLFFLEPLEATALKSYNHWATLVFKWIIEGVITEDDVVREFRKYICRVQSFIALHYIYGSKYSSPFWNHAKNTKISDKVLYDLISLVTCLPRDQCIAGRTPFSVNSLWAQWEPWSIRDWVYAMDHTVNDLILE